MFESPLKIWNAVKNEEFVIFEVIQYLAKTRAYRYVGDLKESQHGLIFFRYQFISILIEFLSLIHKTIDNYVNIQ